MTVNQAKEDVYLVDVERDATNLYLVTGDSQESEACTAMDLTVWLRCRQIQAIYYGDSADCEALGLDIAAALTITGQPSPCRIEDLLARHPGESVAVVCGQREIEEFLDLVCERLPVRRLTIPAPVSVAVVRIGQGRHALVAEAEDALSA